MTALMRFPRQQVISFFQMKADPSSQQRPPAPVSEPLRPATSVTDDKTTTEFSAATNNPISSTCSLEHCPDQILSNILVFGGPKVVATLTTTSRKLRERVSDDAQWRVLCFEYGKVPVQDGTVDAPYYSSWRECYENTLLVPVDVHSLGEAVRSTLRRNKTGRVLIQPGVYEEQGTLDIPSYAKLTIQCLPSATRCGDEGKATLRLADDEDNVNQPLIRVQSGASVTIDEIVLEHNSSGNDYWNGNAAVVCGTHKNALSYSSFDSSAAALLRDCLELESLENQESTNLVLRNTRVSSKSGRGIMAVGEDVTVSLHRSTVEACAATGIFVKHASMNLVDGCRLGVNGLGSSEILPGQSSVFVDRGVLHLTDDCEIAGSIKFMDSRTNSVSKSRRSTFLNE